MATYPNAVVIFHASDTILRANNDASYLTKTESRSCTSVYFFLGSVPSKCAWGRLNVPIYVNCNILKFVTISYSETETGGCFLTGRDVIILQNTFEEMVQTHPTTQVCTYNPTASGIVNGIAKKQQSRAMNIRYFGLLTKKP